MKNEIKYLNSFSANTSVVTEVISRLIEDLKASSYSQSDIDEIVLAMDESMTNSIQATLKRKGDLSPELRDITVRYMIKNDDFEATIIDHGKGIDLIDILSRMPDSKNTNYHAKINQYASDSENKKLKIRVNGEEITLRGIGAGLKIILSFMDSITIDMIDKEKILSDSVTDKTDGTIFNIKRKRRY